MVSGSRHRMMREMVVSCLSGTWDGMAQGAFAPEMMSSTKLSTVSAQIKRDGKSMKNRDILAMRNTLRACWNFLNSQWTKRPWFGVVYVVVVVVFSDCYTVSQSAESHLSRVSSRTTKAKCACHICDFSHETPWHWQKTDVLVPGP